MPTKAITPRFADNLRLLAASQLQTLAARSVALDGGALGVMAVDAGVAAIIVNGLLAWATVLGGVTAFCSGLPAALFALDATPADVRADLINRGMGIGFRIGMAGGLLMFFVFIARIAS